MSSIHNGLAKYQMCSDLDILHEQSVIDSLGRGGGGGPFMAHSDHGGGGHQKYFRMAPYLAHHRNILAAWALYLPVFNGGKKWFLFPHLSIFAKWPKKIDFLV